MMIERVLRWVMAYVILAFAYIVGAFLPMAGWSWGDNWDNKVFYLPLVLLFPFLVLLEYLIEREARKGLQRNILDMRGGKYDPMFSQTIRVLTLPFEHEEECFVVADVTGPNAPHAPVFVDAEEFVGPILEGREYVMLPARGMRLLEKDVSKKEAPVSNEQPDGNAWGEKMEGDIL